MEWLKNIFIRISLFVTQMEIGIFGEKNNRPRIHKIISVEMIDGDFFTSEKWIIVNHSGHTIEAPIFSSKQEAENWLDEVHPKENYAL